jgi:formylglycine-generating enzyme
VIRWPLLLACPLVVACGPEVSSPRDQWRVVLSTDAPVPQFGDRLLVEVLDDEGNACSGCRRQLGAADVTAWPQSFGVTAPEDGGRTRVRARLYRTATIGEDGTPGTTLLIDALGILPAGSTGSGITDVSLVLGMSCFGAPADVAANNSCIAATGQVVPDPVVPRLEAAADLPAPGSWEPSRRVDCTGPAPDGMVCVPGGALLLGAPDFLYPIGNELTPYPEQLVRLSPFWLDRQEVPVGAIHGIVGPAGAPVLRGDTDATEMCTYLGPDDMANDAYPVNCVTHEFAVAACAARGMQLPTEAQWEWAAGNLAQETPFPWPTGPSVTTADICGQAVVGAGRPGSYDALSCYQEGITPGPRPGGSESDVTRAGIGNLGGNLSEWMADSIAGFDDPVCWAAGAELRVDPRCEIGAEPNRVVRGGSWVDKPRTALVYLRNAAGPGYNASIGFRCAKPALP